MLVTRPYLNQIEVEEEVDPFFNNVVALFYFNETGSNPWLDSSNSGLSVAKTPERYDPDGLEGSGAMYTTASTDHFTIDTTLATFGTGDFTIECWVKYSNFTDGYFSAISGFNWDFRVYTYQLISAGTLGAGTTTLPLPQNRYTHLAVSRVNGVSRIFLDGVVVRTQANTSNISGSRIELNRPTTVNAEAQARMDFLRITVGVGRYVTNFTPIRAPNVASGNYLFDIINDPFMGFSTKRLRKYQPNNLFRVIRPDNGLTALIGLAGDTVDRQAIQNFSEGFPVEVDAVFDTLPTVTYTAGGNISGGVASNPLIYDGTNFVEINTNLALRFLRARLNTTVSAYRDILFSGNYTIIIGYQREGTGGGTGNLFLEHLQAGSGSVRAFRLGETDTGITHINLSTNCTLSFDASSYSKNIIIASSSSVSGKLFTETESNSEVEAIQGEAKATNTGMNIGLFNFSNFAHFKLTDFIVYPRKLSTSEVQIVKSLLAN